LTAYLNAKIFSVLDETEQRGFIALARLPVVRHGWAAALGAPPGTERRLEAMAVGRSVTSGCPVQGFLSLQRPNG
jgi:hypothetical protein